MESLGWIAIALVLCAYWLVSSKRLPPDGYRYQSMNMGGAFLLTFYGLWHGALASATANIIWLLIGIVTVFKTSRIPRG